MNKIEEKKEFKAIFQVGKISCNLLHDLISPITGLGLYTESVQDERIKEIIHPIKKSCEDIQNFIHLIQDTIESPDKICTFKLDQELKSAIALGRHKNIKNNVFMVLINKIEEDISISCQKLEFYQLVMNLIGNAVDSFKNTRRKNRRVNVIVEKEKGYIKLSVSDNGCGISKNNIGKVFDKNFTTKENGMGIGLHTVKETVEKKFNGTISVQSKLGKGTIFITKLKI